MSRNYFKLFITFFISLCHVFLYAESELAEDEFSADLSFGLQYDTNIQYRYPLNWLVDTTYEREGGDYLNLSDKHGLFSTINAGMAFTQNTFMIDASIQNNIGLSYPDYSRFHFNTGAYYSKFMQDKHVTLNLSLQSHLSADSITAFDLTYIDAVFTMEVLYDFVESFTGFIGGNAAWYKNLSDELSFLKGPSVGITVGGFYLPEKFIEVISFKLGSQFYLFNSQRIGGLLNQPPAVIYNDYVKPYVKCEISTIYQKMKFLLSLEYAFLSWGKADKWGDWEKRRVDQFFTIFFDGKYKLSPQYYASARYTVSNNISNFGEDTQDYADYSYLQHLISVMFTMVW